MVKAWDGYHCRRDLRADLPGLLAKIKPRKCVWFAGGPAAAVADDGGLLLRRRGGRTTEEERNRAPPRSVVYTL